MPGTHARCQTQTPSRLLLVLPSGIRNIKAATTITDREPVVEHVLPQRHRALGVERVHKAVSEDVTDDDIWMPGAEDHVAVRMDAGPVERHETRFVAEHVVVVLKILEETPSVQFSGQHEHE